MKGTGFTALVMLCLSYERRDITLWFKQSVVELFKEYKFGT